MTDQPEKIFLPRQLTAEERRLFVAELNATRAAWLAMKAERHIPGTSQTPPEDEDGPAACAKL